MKKCFKCKQYKQLDLFYAHPATADKHLNKCKSCTKKDVRNSRYNPKFRSKILQYDRDRNKTEPRKRLRRIRAMLRRRLFKGKSRANKKISNMIRDGKLVRQPCSICKLPNAEAHHPDYRKPTYIIWLCSKHHKEKHYG